MRFVSKIVAIAILGSLITACSSTSEEWRVDGVIMGTVTKEKTEGGYRYGYHNLAGLLVRLEQRDEEHRFRDGPCIAINEYDSQKRFNEERHYDRFMKLTPCSEGYAKARCTYEDDGNHQIRKFSYYSTEDRLIRRAGGYSIMIQEFTSDPLRLESLRFLDGNERPAPSTYKGVDGVTRIEVGHLKAVGDVPLIQAVFFDEHNIKLATQKWSGSTMHTSIDISGYY